MVGGWCVLGGMGSVLIGLVGVMEGLRVVVVGVKGRWLGAVWIGI